MFSHQFSLTSRQKEEELNLVKQLVEKREDFQMLTRLNEENMVLRSHLNRARVKESGLRKAIEEYKIKGQLNRAKSGKDHPG